MSDKAMFESMPFSSPRSSTFAVKELLKQLRECISLCELMKKKLKKEALSFEKSFNNILREVIKWEKDLDRFSKDDQIGKTMLELSILVLDCKKILARVTSSYVFLRARFGKPCKKLLKRVDKLESVLGMALSYMKARSACDGLLKLGAVAGYPAYDVLDFDDAKQLSLEADKHYFGHGVVQNYSAAFRLYHGAANLGDPRAQHLLGMMYLEGLGTEKSEELALKWITLAAHEHGYADSLNQMGWFYETGDSILPQNYQKAADYYQKAVDKGHLDAMTNLGHLSLIGKGVKTDKSHALQLFKKAADQNYDKAQNHLGNLYFHGIGVPEKNYERAVELFRRSAEQGNIHAINNLGVCYEEGKGVVKDFVLASKYYEEASKLGNVSAINNFGYIKLLQHQFDQAAQLLHDAADRGSVDALYNLGLLHDKGLGVPQDIDHAFVYYFKAADQGHAKAQKRVADIFYVGSQSVPKDMKKAVEFYTKSALQGNMDAQNSLGIMYEEGLGVERDIDKAIKWYSDASEQGNAESLYNLEQLLSSHDGKANILVEEEGGSPFPKRSSAKLSPSS